VNRDNNAENPELFLSQYFSEKNMLRVDGDLLRKKLIAIVQHLLVTDFSALVQLLYRIDVSEKDLKCKLGNAGLEQSVDVVVDAILERLEEKRKTRERFGSNTDDIPEDERW